MARVSGPDNLQPLDRDPIMDHKSHFTIQGSAPGYKWAGCRCPAAAAGPSADRGQYAPLFTEVDLYRWGIPA